MLTIEAQQIEAATISFVGLKPGLTSNIAGPLSPCGAQTLAARPTPTERARFGAISKNRPGFDRAHLSLGLIADQSSPTATPFAPSRSVVARGSAREVPRRAGRL